MSRILFMFVTSDNVDTYANAILHSIHNLSVDGFGFLGVQDDIPSTLSPTQVAANVEKQLVSLSQGIYLKNFGRKNQNLFSPEKIDLSKYYEKDAISEIKNFYGQIVQKGNKAISIGNETIIRSKLKSTLQRLKQNYPNCIFDVTAVNKSLLSEILIVATMLDMTNIYTFEIKDRKDKAWENLVHRTVLAEDTSWYEYVNLTDTDYHREYRASISQAPIVPKTLNQQNLSQINSSKTQREFDASAWRNVSILGAVVAFAVTMYLIINQQYLASLGTAIITATTALLFRQYSQATNRMDKMHLDDLLSTIDNIKDDELRDEVRTKVVDSYITQSKMK